METKQLLGTASRPTPKGFCETSGSAYVNKDCPLGVLFSLPCLLCESGSCFMIMRSQAHGFSVSNDYFIISPLTQSCSGDCRLVCLSMKSASDLPLFIPPRTSMGKPGKLKSCTRCHASTPSQKTRTMPWSA